MPRQKTTAFSLNYYGLKTNRFYRHQVDLEAMRNQARWLIHDYRCFQLDTLTCKGLIEIHQTIKEIYRREKDTEKRKIL